MTQNLYANPQQSTYALFEEFMHPLADGSWADPLRLATSQFAPKPTSLGLFQDWGLLKDNKNQTLNSCVDHVLSCIKKGAKSSDPTFRFAFSDSSWILKKLLNGELLLANPIPGLRLSDDSQGPLPERLHVAAFRLLWGPILDELKISELYFFGLKVVKLYRLPNLVRNHKPNVKIYVAAHPRSWSSPCVDRNPFPV